MTQIQINNTAKETTLKELIESVMDATQKDRVIRTHFSSVLIWAARQFLDRVPAAVEYEDIKRVWVATDKYEVVFIDEIIGIINLVSVAGGKQVVYTPHDKTKDTLTVTI